MNTITNRSESEKTVISHLTRSVTDSSTILEATFQNSARNTLDIDVTGTLAGKTVSRIDIDFGDGTTDTIHRRPVVSYDDFENLIGSDSRDPRHYLITHTYTGSTTSSNQVCRLTMRTVERSPLSNPSGEYVFKINVNQNPYDITTAFDNIDIHDTRVYTDEYGNENMLLTFRTQSPEYITSVILKLFTPIRESINYTTVADKIVTEKNIDMTNINLAIS
jgi:molybdopterin-binding protein